MVRKRGNRWWYDFRIKGIRYRSSIPEARTRREAVQAEAIIKAEIFQGKYGLGKSMGLADFARQIYMPWAESSKKSAETDKIHVRRIVEYFGDCQMRDLKQIHVEKFKRERMNTPLARGGAVRKPATVNRELAVLSRMFSLARENGYVSDNPVSLIRKLREDNKRVRYLTEEEEERLMLELTGRYAWMSPLVVVALNTGLRLGELIGLEKKHVDLQRAIVNLKGTKSGRDEAVPLNKEAVRLLADLCLIAQGERIFDVGKRGRTAVTQAFHRATIRAGIEDFHFHDLRHTFATRLADAGTDPFAIAALLRHTTVTMASRYTHATNENLRRAVERLPDRAEKKHGHTLVTIGQHHKEQAAS